MIKFDNLQTVGWEAALRGMRNPKDSWSMSDTIYTDADNIPFEVPLIGEKDLKLASTLHSGGSVHGKYKRYIVIYLDITAPLYWWKEYDTYKVGTVANSCSTMHKIHAYPFSREMFSSEHMTEASLKVLDKTIDVLNMYRDKYLETKDKKYWWQLIQLLPSSFNQKRTVMLNYEIITNMFYNRHNHKLDEWRQFCEFMAVNLPYFEYICKPADVAGELKSKLDDKN